MEHEFAAANRRVQRQIDTSAQVALLRIDAMYREPDWTPAPVPHPAEAFGYQLGAMNKALREFVEALGRGFAAGNA